MREMDVEVRESGDESEPTVTKLVAVIFATALVTGILVSYALRGTEGIAIFLSLFAGLVILFAWRTH